MLLVLSRFNKRRNETACTLTPALKIDSIKLMTILFHDRYRKSYFKAIKYGMKATNRLINLDQTHGDAIDLSEEIHDDNYRPQQQSVFNVFNQNQSLLARIYLGDMETGYKTIMINVAPKPTGFRE